MKKIMLLIVLVLLPGMAISADEKVPSLLKLQLGKTLTECGVPECNKKSLGGIGFLYTNNDKTLCWQADDDSYKKYKNSSVLISTSGYFSLAKMASVIVDRSTGNPATDKIVEATLNFDPDSAAEIFNMLKDKYGKPAMDKTSQIQNIAGAKFDHRYAIWDFRNSRIELDQRYDIKNGMLFLKQGGLGEEVNKMQNKIKSDREKL